MDFSHFTLRHVLLLLHVFVLGSVTAESVSCTTQSQPNPIKQTYPNDITGTINGTTALILIPYDTARSIVPPQYNILRHAYQALLPNLPPDTFPAVLEAVLDHDIYYKGSTIDDFQRISIRIPFVDRLNDGYSSFKYTPPIVLSNNSAAALGFAPYTKPYIGIFEPACDPYERRGIGKTGSTVYLASERRTPRSRPAFQTDFVTSTGNPYGLDFFKNVTNQPFFGSGTTDLCDNFITLFNTSLTTGANAPVSVQGRVSVTTPFYPRNTTFENVWGYRFDNAFVERILQPCESLKGYRAT